MKQSDGAASAQIESYVAAMDRSELIQGGMGAGVHGVVDLGGAVDTLGLIPASYAVRDLAIFGPAAVAQVRFAASEKILGDRDAQRGRLPTYYQRGHLRKLENPYPR